MTADGIRSVAELEREQARANEALRWIRARLELTRSEPRWGETAEHWVARVVAPQQRAARRYVRRLAEAEAGR